MDKGERRVERRTAADVEAAHEHAAELRRRIAGLAEEVAESEDLVAEVYEESARLRPHAADRLREGARQARAYAAKEREYLHDTREAPADPEDGADADGHPPPA